MNESKPNLEDDIMAAAWICDKVRSSELYAQNLYAAMCNNEFQRREVWPILKDERWSCSWRYAGGLVARIVGSGDYMNYYCSGIGAFSPSDEAYAGHANEGTVTAEIEQDLAQLGWTVILDNGDDSI
jgi:hypothetical protein